MAKKKKETVTEQRARIKREMKKKIKKKQGKESIMGKIGRQLGF